MQAKRYIVCCFIVAIIVAIVLMLAPETNGEVAVKAWDALSRATGREHRHLAEVKEDEKIRFRDIAAQPRKIISSPTWSGLESEHVCYNAGYTNVHELIPWRTLTGRQPEVVYPILPPSTPDTPRPER